MNALIILISALMFLASISMLVWTRKQIQTFQHRIDSQANSNALDKELTALNAGTIGLGERFIKLEKKMQELALRLDEVSLEAQNNSSYSYAISLAQKGEAADTIAELCHISQTEAQLLVMMHQQNQAA